MMSLSRGSEDGSQAPSMPMEMSRVLKEAIEILRTRFVRRNHNEFYVQSLKKDDVRP